MNARFRLSLLLIFSAIALLSAGCQTSANFGLNVGIHDGQVKVRPKASLDFLGPAL